MGDGIHPKHRLTKYHNFFTDNINSTDVVLDVGCGNGFNSYRIAEKAKKVVGVDFNEDYILFARKNYKRKNLEFLNQDIMDFDNKMKFDVIILSNVLEHIENRIKFLKEISRKGNKILIRIPMIDRSWLVLYKKEMGIEYRSDKTHYIEYTLKSFLEEIRKTGLRMVDHSVQFGEIWAVVNKP